MKASTVIYTSVLVKVLKKRKECTIYMQYYYHDIYNVDWEQIAFMLVNGAPLSTYPDSVSFCCIVKKKTDELRKNKENYLDE